MISQYTFNPSELKADFPKQFSDLDESNLSWEQLEEIHANYCLLLPGLNNAGTMLAQDLQVIPGVHSVRCRIKHPSHLLAKIVRKNSERPRKSKIDASNFTKRITDLIGIRALHLFKQDWEQIHAEVKRNWSLGEKPTAYVREGDKDSLRRTFRNAGCSVKVHVAGYRSVHYLLKSRPKKQEIVAELQVRTLFEEAWSEIDHQVRYPTISDDPLIFDFLGILNRLAGSADEMGSFVIELRDVQAQLNERAILAEAEQVRTHKELLATIEKLEKQGVNKPEIDDLKDQVERLTATPLAAQQLATTFQMPGIAGVLAAVGRDTTIRLPINSAILAAVTARMPK